MFLLLSSSILIAGGTELVLKSYSTDIDIDTSRIANEASKFTLEKQDDQDNNIFTILSNSEDNATTKQNTTHKFRWIMLELDENLSTGNYWIEHTNFDFTASTFQESQLLDKFSLMRRKFFSFHYHKTSNKTQYFLKTVNA
ncbi:MAG TPA: hypothetical protein ENK66_07305, partial [Arcobacter sp.]|nr:hypothetical protein [Arcobacter sp.]